MARALNPNEWNEVRYSFHGRKHMLTFRAVEDLKHGNYYPETVREHSFQEELVFRAISLTDRWKKYHPKN